MSSEGVIPINRTQLQSAFKQMEEKVESVIEVKNKSETAKLYGILQSDGWEVLKAKRELVDNTLMSIITDSIEDGLSAEAVGARTMGVTFALRALDMFMNIVESSKFHGDRGQEPDPTE